MTTQCRMRNVSECLYSLYAWFSSAVPLSPSELLSTPSLATAMYELKPWCSHFSTDHRSLLHIRLCLSHVLTFIILHLYCKLAVHISFPRSLFQVFLGRCSLVWTAMHVEQCCHHLFSAAVQVHFLLRGSSIAGSWLVFLHNFTYLFYSSSVCHHPSSTLSETPRLWYTDTNWLQTNWTSYVLLPFW